MKIAYFRIVYMLKCCYCYPQNVFKNGLELKGFEEMVKLHLGFEGSTYFSLEQGSRWKETYLKFV